MSVPSLTSPPDPLPARSVRRRPSGAFVSVALAMAACLTVLTPSPATGQTTQGCTFEYHEAPSPGVTGQMHGAVAFAEDDVWGAGWSSVDGDYGTAYSNIVHWDGTAWTRVDAPSPGSGPSGPYVVLYDVDGVATDDLWAVGTYSIRHPEDGFVGFQTLALHWDGSEWRQEPTPLTPAGSSGAYLFDLQAVASDEVYAAGRRTEVYGPDSLPAQTVAVVLRWDGEDWTELPPAPPLSRDENEFVAVHPFPDGDLIAVGGHSGDGNGPPAVPYGARYDADSGDWTLEDLPVPGYPAYIEDMEVIAPDDIWLAGYFDSAPLFVHWDGSEWRRVIVELDHQYGRIWALEGRATDDIWAVGVFQDEGTGARFLAMHWDGTAWTEVTLPAPEAGNLWDVAVVPGTDTAWATGQSGFANRPAPTFRLCSQRPSGMFEDGFESGTTEAWSGTMQTLE